MDDTSLIAVSQLPFCRFSRVRCHRLLRSARFRAYAGAQEQTHRALVRYELVRGGTHFLAQVYQTLLWVKVLP